MAKDIVKMKTPDGLLINVDRSCVPVFEKAGYHRAEPDKQEKAPEDAQTGEKKKQKASK